MRDSGDTRRSLASLSLDVDDKWSYLMIHGDPGWESLPSYLEIVVPTVLDFLKARNLVITFFIVGQDAALQRNHDLLRAIAQAGHEIANHSFKHEPWLHLYAREEAAREITMAEEHIEGATGQRPIGFRGPGYSLSHAVLRELARRQYLYDATTLPSVVGPLARAYYFATASFSTEERRRRQSAGGTIREGFRPIRPYHWLLPGAGPLLEIPVTTMPFFRLPIHASYLLWLSTFSETLALQYFTWTLRLCRLTGIRPSFLLHALDFLGSDLVRDLSFFPAMTLPSAKKVELIHRFLHLLSTRFTIVTVEEHARRAGRTSDLPARKPRFRQLGAGGQVCAHSIGRASRGGLI
jgi:peptidoglycan-N-acetylglucosamine deacetylase